MGRLVGLMQDFLETTDIITMMLVLDFHYPMPGQFVNFAKAKSLIDALIISCLNYEIIG